MTCETWPINHLKSNHSHQQRHITTLSFFTVPRSLSCHPFNSVRALKSRNRMPLHAYMINMKVSQISEYFSRVQNKFRVLGGLKYRIYRKYLHCALASCGVVYCNRSCLWVCLCVGGSVITITRNCVHRSSVLTKLGL